MKRMVIAGGSGFLGRILAEHFTGLGWEVVILTRYPKAPGETFWDGETVGGWKCELDGAEALINLAGKTVNCRYNARNRAEILASRVNSTRALGEAIKLCSRPPRIWLNASTATIYKHTFEVAHDEEGEIGSDPDAKDAFSIEVACAWEKAFEEAVAPGVRKVALRAAMVLGLGTNSVFPMLRRLARLGLGGQMGSGEQYVSWVHARDFCRAVEWIMAHEDLRGVINVAAPNPVRNWEMMRIVRKKVRALFGLPATAWMLEIGAFLLRTETELIIKSRRVIPRRLIVSGFQFEFPEMRMAFDDLEKALMKNKNGLRAETKPVVSVSVNPESVYGTARKSM
jgi:uncharacterized protein (TIGR01777 family)